MATIPQNFVDLLTGKKAFANLATVMKDGSPQVTPVWFDYNDNKIRVNTARGRVKARTLRPGALVAVAIMESQGLFYKVIPIFRKSCIEGITVNDKVLQNYMERSVGIVTALNPVLGYEKTTELAKEALQSGKGILQLIREKKLLTEQQIKDLLDPAKMLGPK